MTSGEALARLDSGPWFRSVSPTGSALCPEFQIRHGKSLVMWVYDINGKYLQTNLKLIIKIYCKFKKSYDEINNKIQIIIMSTNT